MSVTFRIIFEQMDGYHIISNTKVNAAKPVHARLTENILNAEITLGIIWNLCPASLYEGSSDH